MQAQDLNAQIEAFFAKGGKAKECLPGDTAIRLVPAALWQCQCGCHGDFTEHSMRAGESGRCASIIIR